MPARLVDRYPRVSPDGLVSALVPPPLFADVDFAGYRPDPDQPTQAAARDRLRHLADLLAAPTPSPGLFRRRRETPAPRGVYLDGGFGVGKTHLLAALWRAAPPPKAYATFVELTQLAGALGFAATVEALGGMRLLCIDEFELDDPGDTVLVSTLLARLADRGVALAATSNTLPDALGEGRFASADFLREIQGLAGRFDPVRIEGADYRHRDRPTSPAPLTDAEVSRRAATVEGSVLDHFTDVVRHLAELHPSRYGALVDGISLAAWLDVRPAADQAVALRLVVLIDRLYDRQIPVVASGAALTDLFPPDMMAGGYRKKYQRARSRLTALARLGEERFSS